jgi:thioredoxin 1
MNVLHLTKDNFESTVAAPGIVVIDWWAAWCGPCRAFAPTFEKAAEEHPEMTFAKVDTQENPELAGAFQIRSIPTLMFFRDGILLFNQAGMLPARAFDDLLKQIAELDMEEVRREIEKERQDKADGPATSTGDPLRT